MKADYKNWLPKGMVATTAGIMAFFLVLSIIFTAMPVSGPVKRILVPLLWVITLVCVIVTVWMYLMYRAFSYNGKDRCQNRSLRELQPM